MHVKFEESYVVVENVIEIDPLGEDIKRLSLKDSPAQEEKQEPIGDFQEDKEESSQPLPKDWRYTTNHPKELILGDVSKGVTTRSKLHDLCGNFAFISHFEPKSILEAERTHIGYLQCKKSSFNLSATKFGTLLLDPIIDQPLVLNGFLEIS